MREKYKRMWYNNSFFASTEIYSNFPCTKFEQSQDKMGRRIGTKIIKIIFKFTINKIQTNMGKI